jgi:hypothetical protein
MNIAESKPKLLGKVINRRIDKRTALFIDGPALDRASKRLHKKVELKNLVEALSNSVPFSLIRYYTLLPYEDDSRHRSFLQALGNSGIESVVKRLPPKGVTRQVDISVEIATDMLMFGGNIGKVSIDTQTTSQEKKIITLVCPNRDLRYPLELLHSINIDIVGVDFGRHIATEISDFTSKWIDLNSLDTIWRETVNRS